MKTFNEIPEEKYNDISYTLNYLKENKIIGDENPEYNGIFHVYWRGEISDKHIFTVKSILATQKVKKIYFWIEDKNRSYLSKGFGKLMQFSKYIEIKVFDRSVIKQLEGDPKIIDKICSYFDMALFDDVRYRADIFRIVILSIYGGVYSDLDMFLLRDLSEIKLNRWCSKWEIFPKGDSAILKLEKNHKLFETIVKNSPNNKRCFWVFDAMDFKNDNLEVTSLPSNFFDVSWINKNYQGDNFILEDFHSFWKKTDYKPTMKNFLRGCFAYHWHNHWEVPELRNSIAGSLNDDLDKIILQKYNIKSLKLFKNE